MKSIIFGSGYCMYVYLPAIYRISKDIFLKKGYEIVLNKRKNISKFKDKIIWYKKSLKKI
jgi:hypothetical protein